MRKGEEGKGVGILEESEAGVGSAGFIKSRNRRWECRFFIFLKNEEPGVGNAGFENCNLLKPALGMPALKFVIY